MTPASRPRIAILLCTLQGQHFLAGQLDSFAAQIYADWCLWVSDDGSQDGTHAILERYRAHWPAGRMQTLGGPQRGFAANFLSLVCHADIEAAFYAWSDQDDIWQADKLQRAMDWLTQQPAAQPALYCSRTHLVDVENRSIGLSPRFSRPPSFANALVQNVGGGNTMVFNHAARELLREAGDGIDAVSHDWWAYLLVSGAGGAVRYDPYPAVRYRQHGRNLVGANNSWQARATRLRQLLAGRFERWNARNLAALDRMAHRLTPESRARLAQFRRAREGSLLQRCRALHASGVYRQTLAGTLALWLGVVLRKV